MINGGWKASFGLDSECKTTNFWLWNKKFIFETLITPSILYGCEVCGCSIKKILDEN